MAWKPKRFNTKKLRSGFEDRIAANLKERGIAYGYETVRLHYTKLCCKKCGEVVNSGRYTPDFVFQRASGIRLLVEAKGRMDSATRSKMLRVKRDNPSEDIRFLFQRDNTIGKSSVTRYSQWSLKHGFPCAIGETIPQSWIDG
jgi:hypothetical protein